MCESKYVELSRLRSKNYKLTQLNWQCKMSNNILNILKVQRPVLIGSKKTVINLDGSCQSEPCLQLRLRE